MAAPPPSAVIQDLDAATGRHPLDRKLLVCRSMGEGRELLRALAVRGRSWLGWEPTTPRSLAIDLVGDRLAASGRAVADAFAEEAATDAALDLALEAAPSGLRELGDAPGFRQAVAGAVGALRLASIDEPRLRRSPSSNEAVRALLARVLREYQAALDEQRLVDTAGLLVTAAELLEREGAGALAARHVYLAPGISLRGASGRVLRALLAAGAVVLRSDPVDAAVPPVTWVPAPEPPPDPELHLFAASGPADELREVLRRVMDAGLAWDEVEIVATDPAVYGGALHALAERVGVPVSFAVGLPVERTRPGRASAAYFRWIQNGYPADLIRRLLEGGDLCAPGGRQADGPALARRLRSLRVGWGLDRYLPRIDRALERLDRPPRPRRDEAPEEAEARVARSREQLRALREILAPVIHTTPRLDGPGERAVSPAELAVGLRSFLERVPPADAPSATARDRLLAVADRLAATLTRPTAPASAIATVQRHLEIRVPAPQREGSSPWTSAGGYLHLTDIEHGGLTGRRATFVVGLDADRYPGAGLQEPLLQDAQRRALDPESLPTAADRLETTRFRMAAMLARLRGTVTLSYSAWEPTEAREVAPSAVMLEAFRKRAGDPAATFESLRSALGDAASAVPRGALLDGTDLWLAALERDGILLDGGEAVRAAFPGLHQGLRAGEALAGDAATPHHGLVRPRPDRLDPRRNPALVLSASGLEDLGSCPRRYFYRYGLGIRPPDDPELDPDRWLDPLQRGSLLHAVYERTLREAREAGTPPDDDAFLVLALGALEREAATMADELPPPGEVVRARELTELREDVRSFVRMVRERAPDWEAVELRFGFDGQPPAPLELKAGTVRLRGAIDRVDREDGGLTVVDYKTGASDRFARRHGIFHGGRRLQNAVYAAVAERLLERRAERMQYHFPTRRGRNEVVEYERGELRRGLGLIDRLLDAVGGGRFLPTDDPADCTFCDYRPICRHRVEGWRSHTPLADWAAASFGGLAEYGELRDARRWEELFLAELEEHG